MTVNIIVEMQFSTGVASAQNAESLDVLAESLQTALFRYVLPAPISATGLIIQGDGETRFGLTVQAHGTTLRGRFDHVWLVNGQRSKRLGGRFRFLLQSRDGMDGEMFYQIVFDELGNARLGLESGKERAVSIKPDADELDASLREIALGLIKAIHNGMDSIDFSL